MQNLRQVWTTSDFDREYLRNGWRYPKSETLQTMPTPAFNEKKSDELWSNNGLELHVSLDQLKCTFWDTISRPLGGAAPWNF